MRTPPPQSATSLPQAPRDDASSRFAKYAITMSIRIACFLAMVLITPYGWYTWVLGAGAVFLPYIAVVIANAGSDDTRTRAENPERVLPATASPAEPAAHTPATPTVLRISESPRPQPDGETRS